MARKTRQTRQKELIEQEIRGIREFFTSDELFRRVQKKDPGIGIATVYRFLKENAAQKRIHSYMCGKRQVYSAQLHSHCHFTCIRCGRIMHILVNDINFLKKESLGNICHFQVDVAGVCEHCTEKSDLEKQGVERKNNSGG